MNREFENEMDQEEENSRGKSRRRPESFRGFVPAYSQTRRSEERDSAFRRGEEKPEREGALRRGESAGGGRRAGKQEAARLESRRRRRRIIGMIVAEVFALCIIGVVWYGKHLLSLYQPDTSGFVKGETNPNLAAVKVQEMEGYWTVALFGVDSRDNSVGAGSQSDVIILANVDWATGEIRLASVYRDTYLNIDTNGTYNKINSAYFRGGPDQACRALDRNLDIQIDDYGTFSWKAVADAINILGGIDLEISKAEFRYINAYITETVEATGVASVHLKSAGMNHLDGVQAVAYARLRYMDNDFTRTERQRRVIELCFDKLKKADFSVVNNVLVVVLPQIQSSLTLNDLIPMAQNLTKYHIAETTGFPMKLTDQIMGKKGDCVIPDTLESNVVQLHSFLFGDENYTPSSKVREISGKITSDARSYRQQSASSAAARSSEAEEREKETETAETSEREASESSGSQRETSESESSRREGSGESTSSRETLETDEDGNVIDPPEDWEESSSATRPSVSPGESSSSSRPTLSPVESVPGTSAAATISPVSPGSGTTGADENTGPGAAATRTTEAANTSAATTAAPHPGMETTAGSDTGSGPGTVITGPGA